MKSPVYAVPPYDVLSYYGSRHLMTKQAELLLSLIARVLGCVAPAFASCADLF